MKAAQIYRWCELGTLALQRGEAAMNALNVFPIADADTGTNMVITWAEAVKAGTSVHGDWVAGEGSSEVDEARVMLAAMASSASLVAMGSSGMILSQWLTGFAKGANSSTSASLARSGDGVQAGDIGSRDDVVSEDDVRAALSQANRAAWSAVADPVAGTMLTVSTAIASAAIAAPVAPLSAAVIAAREALAATADQLPVEVRTGEVDAGALGLVLVLEALLVAVEPGAASLTLETLPVVDVSDTDIPELEFRDDQPERYEVQYLLQLADGSAVSGAEPLVLSRLREQLAELGDSVVIGGTGDWSDVPLPLGHVHVHVDAADVDAVLHAGAAVGVVDQVRVTPLVEKL